MIVREFINLIGFDIDEQSFRAAERRVESVADKLTDFGQKATLLLTAPFIAGASAAVKFASDAVETQNKFNAVFADNQTEANAWAENYADALDRVDTGTKDSLAIFQSMIVGLGATSKEAFEMSKSLVSLGDDLSSFANKSPVDVQERFLAAMTGSTESVDQFGINLKASALQAEALRQGITKNVTKMSELEKATLRLSIIRDTLTKTRCSW